LAFHTAYSCIFHPCNFARIAFSTPAISVAPSPLLNPVRLQQVAVTEVAQLVKRPSQVDIVRQRETE